MPAVKNLSNYPLKNPHCMADYMLLLFNSSLSWFGFSHTEYASFNMTFHSHPSFRTEQRTSSLWASMEVGGWCKCFFSLRGNMPTPFCVPLPSPLCSGSHFVLCRTPQQPFCNGTSSTFSNKLLTWLPNAEVAAGNQEGERQGAASGVTDRLCHIANMDLPAASPLS